MQLGSLQRARPTAQVSSTASKPLNADLLTSQLGTRNASNALIPCGNNTWSCSKDCTKSTFTIQAGTLELSPAQKSNIGVAEATATVFSDSNLDQSYSRGTLAAVGAGIGGPLALALGLFITLFCVERRRNKNLSKQRSPRLPRLPPYKSSPSSPEPLLNRNPAKSPRWQDQKFSYDSKTHFSNLPRTDSKCVHDSKSHYDTQIQHSRRSPTDVRRSPTHAKKSPTKQRMGLQRSITEPLPLLPLPPQELRAPTPVAELDVRPNSRVPRVDF